MSLPTIPTDNLYKFMALSGLTLLVLIIGAPEYFKYQLDIDEIMLEGENRLLEIDVTVNTELIAEVKEAIKSAKEKNAAIDEETLTKHNKTTSLNIANRKLLSKIETKKQLISCVFRRIVTTHSAANCPPIPLDCDHPFRNIVTTHSAGL